MLEQILLLKIVSFMGVFLFCFLLLLCYLCLYNALHIVDAQIFEEDRMKDRKEKKT